MTWDAIDVIGWTHARRPQLWVLSTSTTGCGCCADGEIVYDAAKAVALVRAYVLDREAELARWRAWLREMDAAASICPVPST